METEWEREPRTMAKIEAAVSPPMAVSEIIVFTFAIPAACGCIHQCMGRVK